MSFPTALSGVPEAAGEVGGGEEHAAVLVHDDGLQPPLDARRNVVGRGSGQPHHVVRDPGSGGRVGADVRRRLAPGVTRQLFGRSHFRRN